MKIKTWSRSILPALLLLAVPALSLAQVSMNVSVNVAPPELPVYDQPPIPQDGYMWTPGYWAWGDDINDYYWVPGTWVPVPQVGYLWTPGYWGFAGGAFLWNAGYWGPHMGFYGGVNYGYGYGGNGYEGGSWQNGHLFYNRSVTNVSNTQITNVYNKTVINDVSGNRVSFNGGNGGIQARATTAQLSAAHERHIEATPMQRQQEQTARSNPALRLSANKGHPAIAATARPGVFSGAGVVAAKHTGTLSVVHQQAPRQAPEEQTKPISHRAQPREAQPREAQPRQPAAEARPREAQPREAQPREAQPPKAAPQARPKPEATPRPEERPPEH